MRQCKRNGERERDAEYLSLDVGNDSFGLLSTIVDQQPARRFGYFIAPVKREHAIEKKKHGEQDGRRARNESEIDSVFGLQKENRERGEGRRTREGK
jgi:hypothetical protein